MSPARFHCATPLVVGTIENNLLYFSFRLLMTNGKEGDLLHYHFSADEFYIMPILVVAFVQQFVVLFLALWSAVVLRQGLLKLS